MDLAETPVESSTFNVLQADIEMVEPCEERLPTSNIKGSSAIKPLTQSTQLIPIDDMMQLSERVLHILRNTKESLSSSQVAEQLSIDESLVNSAFCMLSSHKKVVYQNCSDKWSLKDKQDEHLSEMEQKILTILQSATKPLPTMQIAKALGMKLKKEVNPMLYGLQRVGLIMKTIDVPPYWIALNPSNNVAPYEPMNLLNISDHLPSTLKEPSSMALHIVQSSLTSDLDNKDNLGTTNVCLLGNEFFASLQKNPLSAFHEYGQRRKVEAKVTIIEQCGASHNPRFHATAILSGQVVGSAWAPAKKDAKRLAAEMAMKTLINEQINLEAKVEPMILNIGPKTPFYDILVGLSQKMFNILLLKVPDYLSGRKILATILIQTNDNDSASVVALGTGNRCISGDKLSMEGLAINDSHAEVIARRGLLRFLYEQLSKYNPNMEHPLLEKSTTSDKLRVKANVKFHMYISTAPCGDAALFSRSVLPGDPIQTFDVSSENHQPLFTNTTNQGLLRAKIEAGEGTIPLLNDSQVLQPLDAIVYGKRLRTMSCSDKLLRWNVLGLQGALLNNFLEPIYLSSITLGQLYHQGHLSRAVCCRLQHNAQSDLKSKLSDGFRINHPDLGQSSSPVSSRETERTKAFSMNWVQGDEKPEVTNGVTGICEEKFEKSQESRLCKFKLFQLFKEVCIAHSAEELLNKKYLESKEQAMTYQRNKSVFISHVHELGFGNWLQKPTDEEMFL